MSQFATFFVGLACGLLACYLVLGRVALGAFYGLSAFTLPGGDVSTRMAPGE